MKKTILLFAAFLFLCPAIGMSAFTTSKSKWVISNRNMSKAKLDAPVYKLVTRTVTPEPITVKAGNKYICIMTVDVITSGQATQTGTAVCAAPAMTKCPDAQTCGEDTNITEADWDFAKVGGV